MSKKIYKIIIVLSVLAIPDEITDLVEGIRLRGPGGVNYGQIGFPLLLAAWSYIMLKRKQNS